MRADLAAILRTGGRPSLGGALLLLALLAVQLAACATPQKPNAIPQKAQETAQLPKAASSRYTRPCSETGLSTFACDRLSILAMAGEYRVEFAFEETAALAPGYALHAAQRSGGNELVFAIEDSGPRIALQHILVMGDAHVVVKHWRQVWQYEPGALLRYRGLGRFEREAIPSNASTGAWSQTVFEVDEAPRYAGLGHWTHANGLDAWESDRTWRPLPRREYTKRDDYQVLEVVNRHTLTPSGWIHEQDNTKLMLPAGGPAKGLAREHGLNVYTRTSDYDFQAGRAYWRRTAGYWAAVRTTWQTAIESLPAFFVLPEPDGKARIEALMALADAREDAGSAESAKAIITRYVATAKFGKPD